MPLSEFHVRTAETAASLVEISAQLMIDDRDAWLEARNIAEIDTLNAIPEVAL